MSGLSLSQDQRSDLKILAALIVFDAGVAIYQLAAGGLRYAPVAIGVLAIAALAGIARALSAS